MGGTRCITGLSWAIDNQIVDHPEAWFLKRCYDEGWIYLQTPDAVHFEQARATDQGKREQLSDLRSNYPMPAGVFLLNFSHMNSGLLATPQQIAELSLIHEIIWQRSLESDISCLNTNRKALRRVGDSHIVATSIYNAIPALVTTDQRIHDAGQILSWVFNGFTILSIERAEDIARDGIRRARQLADINPGLNLYQDLPKWP